MTSSARALIAGCAFVAAAATNAALAAPRATVDLVSPTPLSGTITAEGGWDDNVRLLAPVEVAPGEERADAFGGFSARLSLEPREGFFASADFGARRFVAAPNGSFGSALVRGGYRARLGPALLEPAAEISTFAWSVYPEDAHVAAAVAPEVSIRKGPLTLRVVPAAGARRFDEATDLEGSIYASAGVRLGAIDLAGAYQGIAVRAADPELSRTQHRAELSLGVRPARSVALRVHASIGRKALPAFVAEGAEAGRADALVTARATARWDASRALALVGSVEGMRSDSGYAPADFSRLSATLALEWAWELPGAARLREGGRREATFRVDAAHARAVAIAGSFTGWEPVPLRAEKGAWSLTVPLAPGDHRYGYVVDGEWVLPEGVPVQDDGLGGRDALLVVGAE